MANDDKKFTWRDLKKACNKIPEKHLDKDVTIWSENDERGRFVNEVEILKENYLYDGDEGCAPASTLKEAIDEEKKTIKDPEDRTDFYIVHEKGTRILNAS